jgi:hypothetical protein
MTLLDRIRKAQQAQADNQQRHDVQLPLIPYKPTLPLFDSGDPELSREISELFGEGEPKWATESEAREQFHHEIDVDWRDWVRENYGPED